MSAVLSALSWVFIAAGLGFFFTGAIGLLRFPDVYSRLHAVTKADTAGLGMLAAGLALQAQSLQASLMLLLIWLLVMASGTTACQLLARYQLEQEGIDPGDQQ